jgi:hypothetical protein
MDAMVFPIWFGCNALLGMTAWKLARSWFPVDSLLSTIMHTLVLTWAAIVVVAFTLGTLGILTGWMLMASVALVAVIMIQAFRLSLRPIPARTSAHDQTEAWWLWFWLFLVALWIGHSITSGVLKFPTDWDTLHYHLPIIVHWLQAGSLYAPDCCLWSSPGNNEILGLWLVAPFSGDYLIGLNNLPASILLACAAVEIGKQVGLSTPLAHASGFVVVSNFVVLKQMLDASNDVAVAALFLACIAYGLRLTKQEPRPISRDLILFAISLGLLSGVKFFALGYGAVVGIAFFLLSWRRFGWRIASRHAGFGLFGFFLWGGYWYIRNAFMTGCPLYPKTFQPETELITKMYPDIAHTSFIGNGQAELYELAVKAIWHMAGPWHVAAFVFFPVTVVWLLISGWRAMRERETQSADTRWTMAFLIAGAFCVIVNTPFAVEDEPGTLNQMHWYYCPVRYALCFLSLTVLGLAIILQDIVLKRTFVAWIPPLLFLLGGVYQIGIPSERLPIERAETVILAGIIFLYVGNALLISILWLSMRKAMVLGTLVGVISVAALGVHWIANNWHQGFSKNYYGRRIPSLPSFAAMGPAGVICVMDSRCYPFFGSQRQIRVCQPMYIHSPAELMEYLAAQQVQYVAFRADRHRNGWHLFMYIEECVREYPMAFQQITGNEDEFVIVCLKTAIR